MRRSVVTVMAIGSAVVAGCGGDETSVVSRTPDGAECSSITNPAARLSVVVNGVARLRDTAAWEKFDPEALKLDEGLAAVETLRSLEEYQSDPARLIETLDRYEQAIQLTADAAATPAPAESAEAKELATITSDLAEFLGAQKVIVEAREAAGC